MHLESNLNREYPHIEIIEYSNNECSPSKLELSGYWMKINHYNKIGYVWSGFLSWLPAIEWRHNEFVKHLESYFYEIDQMEYLDEEMREMKFEVVDLRTEGKVEFIKFNWAN